MDGLRAVAAFMVLVLHLAGWTGVAFEAEGGSLTAELLSRLAVAVYIFFVISGFLLYRPYASAAFAGRAIPAMATYYRRRFLRIWPAYVVLVLVSLICFHRGVLGDVPRLLRILTLQHIYLDGDFPQADGEPWSAFSQTWSLGTEVSFYLILPLVALLLHRVMAARRGSGPVLVALAVTEVISLLWWIGLSTSSYGDEVPTGWWWLPGYLSFFAAGMALGAVSAHGDRGTVGARVLLVRRHPWVCWGVALAGYAILVSPLAGGHMRQPSAAQATVEHLAYLVIAVGLALPLVLAPGSGPARLLSRRTAAWLGRISYGVFLWHMFVMAVALRIAGLQWGEGGVTAFLIALPLTTGVSVLFAWLSHQLIEQPVRRWSRRRSPSSTAGRSTFSAEL